MSALESPSIELTYQPHDEHAVQFYEDEESLYGRVADFVSAGMTAGEPVVVIATGAHRTAFRTALENKGFGGAPGVVFVDAHEALSDFMVGDMPDESRFVARIGGLLADCGSVRVRAYGEMVDVLWREGRNEAAIRLEELWNDLAKRYTFSLLCAYPMANFYKETDGTLFQRICERHSHVTPANTFSGLTDDERSRELASLQQRAAALETEIKHRREAQRQLNDFFEHAAVAMHWAGPDGTILRANNAELTLLGYDRSEYIGRNIAEFHADAHVIEDILSCLSSGQAIRDYEARLIAKDGSIRHVAITSNALFEDGKFVHTRCFTRDITDRKRLEEQNAFLAGATAVLSSSLDYASRLTDLARIAVPRLADWCAVDVARADGTYHRVGGGPDENAPSGDSDPIKRVLATGEPAVLTNVSNAEGTASWLIVPMKANGRILGAITLIASTSGRRYTHADLPLATELARRAAAAIENARLYSLAQQANRAKDEFLATLSHELRTPLTAILGWARMLHLGGLDAGTARTAIETVERSARAQATLIDDLLDLSKIVTGKITLHNELVDLDAVVDNAVETIRLAADAKNITIDTGSPHDRLVVKGDATRLQQIIWNLLSNSIKFTAPGGRITIRASREGSTAQISVRDDGRGITADFLPHVFEPFRQGDGASTRSHGGLGLGLAIVKHLIELHGGSVVAQSDGEGQGATFLVTLPLALTRTAADDSSTNRDAVDLQGTCVLLVDDDRDTRLVMSAFLTHCGAIVHTASTVDEACHMLHERTPHVVVTDIAMPNRDGFALIEYIRTQGNGWSTIPVIALTAFTYADADRRMEEAGFSARVRKPIEPMQFARLIAKTVTR